ncbi:Pumilio homolog 2 (Pumilio-2) [Durusdinium trenchii]|uniref:Pumilio homolog 2 (Pumilio-2) n=1 Tax=Durusdinium trenchii TaxID=1381693 RepID=A0ABP0PQY4_9DINO
MAAQMPMMCPQQVFLLVPAEGDLRGNYVALWESPVPVPKAEAEVVPAQCATPRTELPTDESADEVPRHAAPRATQLTASTARRLRRKRAAERVRMVQSVQLRVPSMEDFRTRLKKDQVATVRSLKGYVWAWSQNPVGCRLIQEVFELGSRDAAELAQELQGHVLEAVMCPYANYVVQKVVSHLSSASSAFVARELSGSAARVAKHRFACRIFCRLLEFCPSSTTDRLVDELLVDLSNLCSHNFAHHVIESVLENGSERHKASVAEELIGDAWRYATHKNSSYIIEKALRHCSEAHRQALTRPLGQPRVIFDLALTQFGCYVARALLQEGIVDTEAAMKFIKLHQSHLEASSHGQRFLVDVGLQPEQSTATPAK